MDKEYITKSYKETQKLGEEFAKEVFGLPKNIIRISFKIIERITAK
ncbi:MAG: hypothetical protein Q8Q48_04055 [Candidatus Staskawiczbacteria bacterium]|nr:hypothetical protein [Candidatus Staskawiczbacteria bacterium]